MPMYYPNLPKIFWKRSFFLIGLTGTIASGKSQAASCFREVGAILEDADKIAKESLHMPQTKEKMLNAFGKDIFNSKGELLRSHLAQMVFQDESKRKILNAIIHPMVQERLRKTCQTLVSGDILVYDVPLLFELQNRATPMDLNIVIDAPQRLRYQRIQKRNQWSYQEFLAREKSQFSADKKKQFADLVLMNVSSLSDLLKSVTVIYSAIKKGRK